MILASSLSTGFIPRDLCNPLTHSLPLWLISSLIFFCPAALSAQNWTDAQTFGEGQQSLEALLPTEQGLLLGLAFSESYGEINSVGERDLLLLRRSAAGEVELLLHGGSTRDDDLDVLAEDADGNLILAGAFWSSIDFGSFQLTSSPENPRALFLIKIDPEGNLLWSQTFEGGSIKQINDLVLDAQGNIFMGGYFDQELQFADTSLLSTAESSAFYARFRKNGALDWCHSFGETGNTRATVVEQYAGRQYLLGGYYDDSLKVASQNFPANTNDDDAFLLALDTSGQVDWVRKAGGVFNELPTGLAVDETGHSYLAGQLVGVLVVNDSLRIESRDGNADCFLIRYDSLGQADWAQSFGGDQLQFTNDLLYDKGQLWLTGHYQENLEIGSLRLEAGAALTFEGFISSLDTNGQVQELTALPGAPGTVLANHLAISSRGIWLGGDLSGQLTLGGFQLESFSGSFTSYIVEYGVVATATHPGETTRSITIFPNPTRDQLFITSAVEVGQYSIWNQQGQCLRRYQNTNKRSISVAQWPAGLYYLWVQHAEGVQILPFVIR
ncbi:MAG TPA: T9SS type A sorting domain-containing protein [Saprospiraceae bacterium]|nr:T9SS type A sorting domain-containing protein [Saprospiraceae bacterium]